VRKFVILRLIPCSAAYSSSARKLSRIPKSALKAPELERLNLSGNELSALPREIAGLKKLRSLNLSGNKFSSLGPAIGDLKALEYLNLQGNRLAALPESLGRLPSLSILDLRDNRFTSLPAEAASLLRAGATVIVDEALARAYGNRIFETLDTNAINRETRFAYSVAIDLPEAPDRGARVDIFYPPAVGALTVFEPLIPYALLNRTMPCSHEEENPGRREIASLGDDAVSKYLQTHCPAKLFAHGPGGVEKLRMGPPKFHRVDCCGSPCLRVTAELAPTRNPALFYSTTAGAKGKAVFVRLTKIVTPGPEWLRPNRVPLPEGFLATRIDFYKYPGLGRDAYLAFVAASGIVASDTGDGVRTLSWTPWQAVYLYDARGPRILTPASLAGLRAYGTNLEPAALYDVSGDHVPDLLLGNPVSLILERHRQGFRSWGVIPPDAPACAAPPESPPKIKP